MDEGAEMNTGRVVLMLLWLYVGAYLATVSAVDVADSGPPFTLAVYPSCNGLHLRSSFEPVHQVDRILRPHMWNPALPDGTRRW
jgi:hypothetical protein